MPWLGLPVHFAVGLGDALEQALAVRAAQQRFAGPLRVRHLLQQVALHSERRRQACDLAQPEPAATTQPQRGQDLLHGKRGLIIVVQNLLGQARS